MMLRSDKTIAADADILSGKMQQSADPALRPAAAACAKFKCKRLTLGKPQAEQDMKVPSFGSLPSLHSAGQSVRGRLDSLVQEVAAHYDVEVCTIALEKRGGMGFLSRKGLDVDFVPHKEEASGEPKFSFFRHHVTRHLPIIIGDTLADARLKGDPLVVGRPNLRFYAGAPISLRAGEYSGTLCIASSKPVPNFELDEADFLMMKAQEVAEILKPSSSRRIGLGCA